MFLIFLQANGFVTNRVGEIERQSVKQQPVKIDTLKGHIYFAKNKERRQRDAVQPMNGHGGESIPVEESSQRGAATGGADATDPLLPASGTPSSSPGRNQDAHIEVEVEVDVHKTSV